MIAQVQYNFLSEEEKMWALDKMHALKMILSIPAVYPCE